MTLVGGGIAMVSDLMRRDRSGDSRNVRRRAIAWSVDTSWILEKRKGVRKAFHDEFTRQSSSVSLTRQKMYRQGHERRYCLLGMVLSETWGTRCDCSPRCRQYSDGVSTRRSLQAKPAQSHRKQTYWVKKNKKETAVCCHL